MSENAKENIAKLMLHMEQVEAGLIPSDSPPTFTLPEGPDAVDENGLPWWFGSEYHPTDEALAEFAKRPKPEHQDESEG